MKFVKYIFAGMCKEHSSFSVGARRWVDVDWCENDRKPRRYLEIAFPLAIFNKRRGKNVKLLGNLIFHFSIYDAHKMSADEVTVARCALRRRVHASIFHLVCRLITSSFLNLN